MPEPEHQKHSLPASPRHVRQVSLPEPEHLRQAPTVCERGSSKILRVLDLIVLMSSPLVGDLDVPRVGQLGKEGQGG